MPRSEEDIRNCLHRHHRLILLPTRHQSRVDDRVSPSCVIFRQLPQIHLWHACSPMTAATDQVGCSPARLPVTLHTILAYNWTSFRTTSAILKPTILPAFCRNSKPEIRYLDYAVFFIKDWGKYGRGLGTILFWRAVHTAWGNRCLLPTSLLLPLLLGNDNVSRTPRRTTPASFGTSSSGCRQNRSRRPVAQYDILPYRSYSIGYLHNKTESLFVCRRPRRLRKAIKTNLWECRDRIPEIPEP